MLFTSSRIDRKQRIRLRIRKKVQGTAERPRLVPTISNRNIYVQLIDDTSSKTLVGILAKGKNEEAAKRAGKKIGEAAKTKKITNVVFDRAARRYHGVVKALSEEARKAGLML